MTSKKKPEGVNRRDTLKLATALSALGVGLGVTVNEREAHAETHKIDVGAIGALTLKFYKENNGKSQLLHTLDLTSVSEAGKYSLKLTNFKASKTESVAEHVLEVTQQKG